LKVKAELIKHIYPAQRLDSRKWVIEGRLIMMAILETTFPSLAKNQNKPTAKQDFIKPGLF